MGEGADVADASRLRPALAALDPRQQSSSERASPRPCTSRWTRAAESSTPIVSDATSTRRRGTSATTPNAAAVEVDLRLPGVTPLRYEC
jgi:hypothetical protein